MSHRLERAGLYGWRSQKVKQATALATGGPPAERVQGWSLHVASHGRGTNSPMGKLGASFAEGAL